MNYSLLIHELRQGMRALAIWTLSIGAFMVLCILLFPEISTQMADMSDLFASMGAFSAAFGLDKLNFGTFMGFYSAKCGSILLLGGALYAAITGIQVLAKEEDQHTAEFLFAHPLSRTKVVCTKLVAVLLELLALNIVISGIVVVSLVGIGEAVPWRDLGLLHTAFACVQVELACLCFGLSAFFRHSQVGLGLGLALTLYFIELLANIADSVSWLHYFTPFGYADGATIMTEQSLDSGMLLIGAAVSVVGVATGFIKYRNKDIYA